MEYTINQGWALLLMKARNVNITNRQKRIGLSCVIYNYDQKPLNAAYCDLHFLKFLEF